MKQLYLLPLLAILALTGCKKDDDASRPGNLTIEQTEYTLDADEERTATVAFIAAADWTLSVVYDDAESAADWLSVTPASGTAGEQTVELSATRNFRASARTAYADIACGKQSVRLTVTQAAASDATDFTAQFDPDFAKELQKQDIIADAEHITPEDMEKIAAITRLDVGGSYDNPGTLTSLRGIEYFEALEVLFCLYNQLTSLDVRRNTALTELYCNDNQLTALDVSQNTALETLFCRINQFTSLDVSRNTALTYLSCAVNELTSLDVSANTELTDLACNSNELTSLDVSRNTTLTYLDCDDNLLPSLDVSRNTALTELYCSDNQLTSLDVSRNTALTQLYCSYNPGDGVSSFPITAWFDNDTKPDNLEIDREQWTYDGKSITIDFRKAE